MNFQTRIDAAGQPPFDLWDGDASPPPQDGFDIRRALQLTAGLFVVLILLAAFVPMGAAVIGTGQVGLESQVKRIAHPTGGVITEIAVKNGDFVKKGQLLMRLDDRVSTADALYSNQTVEQLLAQRARLEATRLGENTIRFPPELTQAATASARTAIADEARLFDQRRREEVQLRAQLALRMAQYREEISGTEAEIDALQRQLKLIEPERAAMKELKEKGLVTISRVNQLERSAADLDGSIGSRRARIAEANARISEVREQSIQLGETRRIQASTDLAQVNTALNQQQLRSVAAADQQDRREIRAPYAGRVEKLAYAAIGEVVRAAEPIMEILPDRDRKIVEVAVSPADIDQIKVGQKARVKFTAFNRATTPEIPGTIIYVAQVRSENADRSASFFVVRAEIDPAALVGKDMELRSGMPAEVYIETGSRSLLSYFFKPLRDQLARAFSDN